MLNKLVEISKGKQLSVTQHEPRVPRSMNSDMSKRSLVSKSAFSSISGAGATERTRSLNFQVRKRENDRIERENHKFAKRLYSNQGSISRQKLENDYQSILKFKKMLSRVKKNKPSFNGRFHALPPLATVRSNEDLKPDEKATATDKKVKAIPDEIKPMKEEPMEADPPAAVPPKENDSGAQGT